MAWASCVRWLMGLGLCAGCMLPAAAQGLPKPVLIGYYPYWTSFQNQFSIDNIPLDRLDFLTYVYAKPNPDGSISPGNFVADLNFAQSGLRGPDTVRGNYAKLREEKIRHPGLHTLISIGGWTYSDAFPELAASPVLRQKFAAALVAFIDHYGFDGVEIDWQYPVVGGPETLHPRPDDQRNKISLLQTIRQALDEHTRQTGQRYWLSTTLGASPLQLTPPLTRSEVEAVDFAVVDAYDYYGAWEKTTGHSAALYGRDSADESNVTHVMELLKSRGVPADKLVLMIDAEANSWVGVKPANHGLYQPFTGVPYGSWDDTTTGPTGTFTMNEVLDMARHGPFTEYWDDKGHASYLYSAVRGQFVSFESPRALREKLGVLAQAGYAGIGLWEVASDARGADSLLRIGYRDFHPWRGAWLDALEAWHARPSWADGVLGGVLALLALPFLLIARRRYVTWRRDQFEADVVQQVRSNVEQLLPLLFSFEQDVQGAMTQIALAGPAAQQQRVGMGLALANANQLTQMLMPLVADAPPALDPPLINPTAAPIPVQHQPDMEFVSADSGGTAVAAVAERIAVSPLVERLTALGKLTETLSEQRSVEKMLDAVMNFLAMEQAVRAVALLQDGELQESIGNWVGDAGGETLLAGEQALGFSADRLHAWLKPDHGSDHQLAIAFNSAASDEDEAVLRHLVAQMSMIRQQLTELTRQPHVLSELYEIASRKDKLLYVRADKGYSGIYTQDSKMPLYVTLRLRTIRLYFPDDVMLQVHRSYLVNPKKVERALYKGKGLYELALGAARVPVRKQYAERLREQFGRWFE
ncbi:glycosyl hydrolase family 18 protein [Andreprevotia chitinilytica]|uniref:glycosyl hydrolase family 18 protein n=1 Tax=Andreprevotia chitinilytica TaxID=396808 RepID=UPI000A004D7C|nr:glycosyl hydrolase family 18 protein [Andreprevotia chitinilytica]